MHTIYSFLEALHENNNREWFNAHKDQYTAAKEGFEAFVEKLIERIAEFDPTITGTTVKESVFRIYRDTRFAKNKEPYKTHMGAYICQGGKNSSYSGYYFHIEPDGLKFIGGSSLVTGLYHPQPKVIQSVREEILDNSDQLLSTICHAKGFTLDTSEMLKRTPKNFPVDFPHPELLKNKNYYICHHFDNKQLKEADFLDYAVEKFKSTYEFNKIINRAVQYALEEM